MFCNMKVATLLQKLTVEEVDARFAYLRVGETTSFSSRRYDKESMHALVVDNFYLGRKNYFITASTVTDDGLLIFTVRKEGSELKTANEMRALANERNEVEARDVFEWVLNRIEESARNGSLEITIFGSFTSCDKIGKYVYVNGKDGVLYDMLRDLGYVVKVRDGFSDSTYVTIDWK